MLTRVPIIRSPANGGNMESDADILINGSVIVEVKAKPSGIGGQMARIAEETGMPVVGYVPNQKGGGAAIKTANDLGFEVFKGQAQIPNLVQWINQALDNMGDGDGDVESGTDGGGADG